MYFIGYGCSFIPGDASFRTAWSMQFIPCVFLIIGLPFLPESPRWLAMKDRNEEAIEILAGIQAGGDRNNPLVVAEWEDIQMTLIAERQALPGWRKFVYNGMWKRTLAGFTVQMWQQNSGANVMTYVSIIFFVFDGFGGFSFASILKPAILKPDDDPLFDQTGSRKLLTARKYVVYIFSMADLSGNINLIASGVQYALFIIFTGVMFFYVDKVGRRPLLIGGALLMGICHIIVGGLLSMGEVVPGGVEGDRNVPIRLTGAPAHTVIAFSYLLIIIYALTLAPVCWIYAAEVWSLETRAVGMGIAANGNWLFNFALGLYIPPGFINIKYAMFIIFGLMCFLAAAHFYLAYPETANKTLEEIEEMFAHGGPKPWQTRRGESRLDALLEDAKNNHLTIDDVNKDGAKRAASVTHSVHVEDVKA